MKIDTGQHRSESIAIRTEHLIIAKIRQKLI